MALRQRKLRVPRVRKTMHVMKGGPWDGQKLYLSSPGTLTFTVRGQTGHYNRFDEWVEAK